MTNENMIPSATEGTETPALSYRKNSACWAIHTSLMGMAGEFDMNMVLQVARDFAKTNNVDLGNDVRTVRHVVQQMLTAGQLSRVKRGRWTVKK